MTLSGSKAVGIACAHTRDGTCEAEREERVGLEGQHKDSDGFNEAMRVGERAHGRECLHE